MIQITTLDNGLRIVTQSMPSLETVAMGFWNFVGARDESINVNGVAHFLEHMAFKGTKSRTAFQIAEEIDNVGGDINAYTSNEATAYHVKLIAEDFGKIEVYPSPRRNPFNEPLQDIKSNILEISILKIKNNL